MPHKHTRRNQDPSTFDLPPSQFAKPLPVRKEQPKDASGKSKSSADVDRKPKRKRNADKTDDAPRAFKRLMAYADGRKPRSGLDNGEETPGKKKTKNNKKRKAAQASEGTAAAAADAASAPTEGSEAKKTPQDLPKILPGERMSDFAARVDAALPISGLVNKSVRDGKDPLGLKVWRTNKERKMHKLYDEWREEERKIKEKREEELDEQEERELEEEEAGVSWKLNTQGGGGGGGGGKKRKKKGGNKRTKYVGEVGGAEEDPWEELRKKRGESRPGLHDVAQAPPELHLKTAKKLTVRGAAVEVGDVPKAAGSLRRREELQSIRDDVVASYRKMMESKRPALQS